MILTIDCSTENAFVCLADKGVVVATKLSDNQKNHASFLHVAIKALMDEAKVEFSSLDGIAVVAGPGSYTGVRVAMASAKGLCLALKKPFLSINGLELLALACYNKVNDDAGIYIPMIDARRMEVFTGVYSAEIKNISPAINYILSEHSFEEYLNKSTVHFIGNAVTKAKNLIQHSNAKFCEEYDTVSAAAQLAYRHFISKNTADLFLTEPLYIKPFFEG